MKDLRSPRLYVAAQFQPIGEAVCHLVKIIMVLLTFSSVYYIYRHDHGGFINGTSTHSTRTSLI